MDKREFHDLAFAEQGAEENFGDTIERIYARVVAERDAARAEADALREKLSEPHHCCCCGKNFFPAALNRLCDRCYEDHIA